MAGDGPGQPAYDIFSIERTFLTILSFDLSNSKSLPYRGLEFKYSFKMHYYFIAYIDCQGGRIAAIARHVSYAQITCFIFSRPHSSNGRAIGTVCLPSVRLSSVTDVLWLNGRS